MFYVLSKEKLFGKLECWNRSKLLRNRIQIKLKSGTDLCADGEHVEGEMMGKCSALTTKWVSEWVTSEISNYTANIKLCINMQAQTARL